MHVAIRLVYLIIVIMVRSLPVLFVILRMLPLAVIGTFIIVGRSALQRHRLHHSAVVNPNGFVRYPAPSCLTCEHLI